VINHNVEEVEEFDADLASASEAEDEVMVNAIEHNAVSEDEDDDIDFDDGLALPPSQAPVPTPSMQPYQSPAVNGAGSASAFNQDTGVVSSEEDEDDDEDEEDFADLANDLETSLEPRALEQPQRAAGTQQQRQSVQPAARIEGQSARRSAPAKIAKKYDSDLASSSESDDEG
jgi:hypothetical protein